MNAILGIDIARATFDVELRSEAYPPQLAQFENDPTGFADLQRWLKNYRVKRVHACLEATGRYGDALALFLHDQGHLVSVVNPLRIKAYAESQLSRNKTDQIDAHLIADFCRTQHPPIWSPPSPAWCELNALTRRLHSLETIRQQEHNRLTAGIKSPFVIDNLQEHIAFLDKQIEQLKGEIAAHLNAYPDLKAQKDLIVSIPGLGELTAGKLLAEYRDFSAFSDVRQIVAFAGLNPQHRRSGSSVRGRTRISKKGSSAIRAALYMPAVVAKQHNPILRDFAQRLQDRGLTGMEIVVAVMRKLLHQVYGVLKSGQPFDPNYLRNSAA